MKELLDHHLLTVLIFLPTAGAVLLCFFPKSQGRAAMRAAIAVSVAELALSVPLWTRFAAGDAGFQFAERANWVPALGITYSLGIDGISLVLILLTTLLTPVSLLFSVSHVAKSVRAFAIAFLVLETGMIGTLAALDLALFYVFWEVMLVPMYFIIGVWGGARRIYAAMKFFLFTMAGSLLMFLAILYLAVVHHTAMGRWSFLLADLTRLEFPASTQALLFFAFALAESVIIKAVGIGIGIAVILDATVVRGLLVPATMRLMGHWNWWLPGPIARLVRRDAAPAARGASAGGG